MGTTDFGACGRRRARSAGRMQADHKIALMLNLGEPRPGLPAGTSADVAWHLRTALELDVPVHHAMEGHAGGIVAMEAAGRLLDAGREEAVTSRRRRQLSRCRHAGVAGRAGAASFRRKYLWILPGRGGGLRPARETGSGRFDRDRRDGSQGGRQTSLEPRISAWARVSARPAPQLARGRRIAYCAT